MRSFPTDILKVLPPLPDDLLKKLQAHLADPKKIGEVMEVLLNPLKGVLKEAFADPGAKAAYVAAVLDPLLKLGDSHMVLAPEMAVKLLSGQVEANISFRRLDPPAEQTHMTCPGRYSDASLSTRSEGGVPVRACVRDVAHSAPHRDKEGFEWWSDKDSRPG